MTTMQTSLTVKLPIHFTHAQHGRKQIQPGPPEAPPSESIPLGRTPRIARLMALAIRFDDLLARGEVHDYADLSRLGHVTRARVTQIMNLLNLAPDIQEELLFLPPIEAGCDMIKEWQIRPIAAEPQWRKQRKMWRELRETAGS